MQKQLPMPHVVGGAGSKRHWEVFFWMLFFGEAKERNSSVGTRTHIKISVGVVALYKSPSA
jgi:hypothetical protein